jgi:hypothetical protein
MWWGERPREPGPLITDLLLLTSSPVSCLSPFVAPVSDFIPSLFPRASLDRTRLYSTVRLTSDKSRTAAKAESHKSSAKAKKHKSKKHKKGNKKHQKKHHHQKKKKHHGRKH